MVEQFRLILKGVELVPKDEAFEVVGSRQHGNVKAVLNTMYKLGLDKLIGFRRSRERDLVMGMIAGKILAPESSKLSMTQWWKNTTLPEELGISDADENELYSAMDWLLKRQNRIENKLAKRHLQEGGMVLYDLTSSYVEGENCPLATFGHNRDKKKGKKQIEFGLLTDKHGCPVSVSVFAGNTSDPKTVMEQVKKLEKRFGIQKMVLVGDRGMLTQTRIEELKKHKDIRWITAIRSSSISKLLEGDKPLQLELFDDRNLFEFEHEKYPGERLIACRNPDLAKKRGINREELIEATKKDLEKVKAMVDSGRLSGMDKIGVRAGRVLNKHNMAKHFKLSITDNGFEFEVDQEKVDQEAALDGIYIIRTSVEKSEMTAEDSVKNYKSLSNVENAFRSFKTMDLHVRPIYHYLENRVRAHIFLCMLAYYVQWHMQQALRPLTFADDEIETAKTNADPVGPAQISDKAKKKKASKQTEDDFVAMNFRDILDNLATIVRNTIKTKPPKAKPFYFKMDTTPNEYQKKVFELLDAIIP